MRFLMEMLARLPFWQRHRLEIESKLWREGVGELRKRAGGVRESGAFLLGRIRGKRGYIEQFIFYDDLDPNCLRRGYIQFNGGKLGQLWQICRGSNLDVVADVHVHPGGYGQSDVDRANPMIPAPGHLALIIPYFARQNVLPGGIGIYEYRGGTDWLDLSRRGTRIMKVR